MKITKSGDAGNGTGNAGAAVSFCHGPGEDELELEDAYESSEKAASFGVHFRA